MNMSITLFEICEIKLLKLLDNIFTLSPEVCRSKSVDLYLDISHPIAICDINRKNISAKNRININ